MAKSVQHKKLPRVSPRAARSQSVIPRPTPGEPQTDNRATFPHKERRL